MLRNNITRLVDCSKQSCVKAPPKLRQSRRDTRMKLASCATPKLHARELNSNRTPESWSLDWKLTPQLVYKKRITHAVQDRRSLEPRTGFLAPHFLPSIFSVQNWLYIFPVEHVLWTVSCTMFSIHHFLKNISVQHFVQSFLYSISCTSWLYITTSVQHFLYIVSCATSSVQNFLCRYFCAAFPVQPFMYNILCTTFVYSNSCTAFSVLYCCTSFLAQRFMYSISCTTCSCTAFPVQDFLYCICVRRFLYSMFCTTFVVQHLCTALSIHYFLSRCSENIYVQYFLYNIFGTQFSLNFSLSNISLHGMFCTVFSVQHICTHLLYSVSCTACLVQHLMYGIFRGTSFAQHFLYSLFCTTVCTEVIVHCFMHSILYSISCTAFCMQPFLQHVLSSISALYFYTTVSVQYFVYSVFAQDFSLQLPPFRRKWWLISCEALYVIYFAFSNRQDSIPLRWRL